MSFKSLFKKKEIKRSHYMLMPKILEVLNSDKDIKMANIIALKLSLLFGLKDKEIVTQEFEAQKAEYKETVDSFNTIKIMLNQLNETKLEDEVFIGSNTSLVAPVKLGKKSYTGAGSVITKNVPPETLAIGRSRQSNIKRKK